MNKDLLQKEYEIEAFNAGMKKAYERAAEEVENRFDVYDKYYALRALADFFRQMAK